MGPGGVARVGDENAPAGSCKSQSGRTVEKAAVRWVRVAVRVVPACPMGKATNSTCPQCFLRAAMKGEYFLVSASSLVSHPKSRQKPISIIMKV
jgi:hypothetical protein